MSADAHTVPVAAKPRLPKSDVSAGVGLGAGQGTNPGIGGVDAQGSTAETTSTMDALGQMAVAANTSSTRGTATADQDQASELSAISCARVLHIYWRACARAM